MELELFTTLRIAAFILLSILLIAVSWQSLCHIKSHGFYRFFAFEGALVIVLLNIPFWIKNPLSPPQLVSWVLLFSSITLVILGLYFLSARGAPDDSAGRPENYSFENTTRLVTAGPYKYIRHPMYSSLLLLAWGALIKHITIYGSVVVLIETALLVMTAKKEESENILLFGSPYEEYIKKTKMFIPWLF